MSQYKCALVFVHLGRETPSTLEAFSGNSSNKSDSFLKILVTDKINNQIKFDGEVIIWKELSSASKALLMKRNYYSKIASGYWLNTFERIFALRALFTLPTISSLPVIHLESDVLPLFNSSDVDFLSNNFSKVAIPRFSETRGIGSFVFSPNIQVLTSTLDELEVLAISNSNWLENDMELLGLGLKEGLLMELPSHPSDYRSRSFTSQGNHRILFDGAALGQYLFGQDPFHQSGLRYSGFKNPPYFSRTNIDSMRWGIESNSEETMLIVEFDKVPYKVANVHVHSKEVLPPLSADSKRWQRAIDEANGRVVRIQERATEISPHLEKPSLWIRFEIAKTRGLKSAVTQYVANRLKRKH
jgi:hypothetical protein